MFDILLKPIDNFLNRITMYRLVLYFLLVLVGVAFGYCLFGILPFDPWTFLRHVLVLVVVSWIANKIFSLIVRVPTNVESDYITALILSLITTPGSSLVFLILVAVIAQASKYILVYRGKHIFNPAAVAVLITFYAIGEGASWWIGGAYILPIVIIGGFLIVRKTQKFHLTVTFLTVVVATMIFNSTSDTGLVVRSALIDSALFFFTFVMLTEPLTMPTNVRLRMIYAVIVAIIYGTTLQIGNFTFSPEFALVVGNIFAFVSGNRGRFRLMLKSKNQIATDTYNFSFEPSHKPQFAPGQYMEWTVDPARSDNRGNRRYFTLASSPTENDVMLGVKFYEKPSTFKTKLSSLNPGDRILAGQVSGDFVLPRDQNKKLAFIAGGIGITPFRSMIKYLSDRNEKRDIVLFYSVKNESEIAYKEIFEEAKTKLGAKIVIVETDKVGFLNADMIKQQAADYQDRMFYISGPRAMVVAFEDTLKKIGVRKIKVDFFPGYV